MPGEEWPDGITPSYLFVTGCGSVFYGNYDLAGSNWSFTRNTLSWESGSDPSNGAPPAGKITFGYYAADALGPNGYIGPYFKGNLMGRLGPIAAGQPDLMTPTPLPAVERITA